MSKTIDKEIEFRNELAKIAFEKLMSSCQETLFYEYKTRGEKYNGLDIFQFTAMVAVRYADAMVEELEK